MRDLATARAAKHPPAPMAAGAGIAGREPNALEVGGLGGGGGERGHSRHIVAARRRRRLGGACAAAGAHPFPRLVPKRDSFTTPEKVKIPESTLKLVALEPNSATALTERVWPSVDPTWKLIAV